MITCILCGLYLTGGLSVHHQISIAQDRGYTYWMYDQNQTKNPYGIAAAGYELLDSKKLRIAVEFRHESSIATGKDHGLNEGVILIIWRPFK